MKSTRPVSFSACVLRVSAIILALVLLAPRAAAQQQSTAPAAKALSQKISQALVQAGIDPRITSVQVITASNHTVYLTGLISDQNTIKLAGTVAAKNAPGYHVVNNIKSGFFDDQNHVTGGQDK